MAPVGFLSHARPAIAMRTCNLPSAHATLCSHVRASLHPIHQSIHSLSLQGLHENWFGTRAGCRGPPRVHSTELLVDASPTAERTTEEKAGTAGWFACLASIAANHAPNLTNPAAAAGSRHSTGCQRVSMDILNPAPLLTVDACTVRMSNTQTSPISKRCVRHTVLGRA